MNEVQDQDQAYLSLSTTSHDASAQLSQHHHRQLLHEQEPNVQLHFDTDQALPMKWMSSKMRLMRKMMSVGDRMIFSDKQGSQDVQDVSSSSSSSSGLIRTCSNCSTTKTPLWRSGPQGPKSLCNACGIRQMKARRAMRAAAAAAGGPVAATAPKKAHKETRLEADSVRTVPFKKRFKIAASYRFNDIVVGLSKKLAFHQAFPQEEKDAAILLMALSCSLMHG